MDRPQIDGQIDIYEQLALKEWAAAVACAPVLLPLVVANQPPAHLIPSPGLRLSPLDCLE